jgi:dTDP-4-dehydrorhamnose reductase
VTTPKILIFGANGQLGSRLMERLPNALGLTQTECDFENLSPEAVGEKIAAHAPNLIINATAYTAVDKAETERARATFLNTEVPSMLARQAQTLGAHFLHFSTDYAYDGAEAPYAETAETNPLNVYGVSKCDGDLAVLNAHESAVILRLQWLYDGRGSNFLTTMARALRTKESLRVVADQLGAPSFAGDIAEACTNISARLLSGAMPGGIYHTANQGYTSWHGFACAIADELRARGVPLAASRIDPLRSHEYETAAKRPRDTRLNTDKLAELGITLPHWRSALTKAMEDWRADA